MRKLRTRCMSFVLALSLCLSMWTPSSYVLAEENTTTATSETKADNATATTEVSTEATTAPAETIPTEATTAPTEAATTSEEKTEEGGKIEDTNQESADEVAGEPFDIIFLDTDGNEIKEDSVTLNGKGTQKLQPRLTDKNGKYIADAKFECKSSDENVVKATQEEGILIITAEDVKQEGKAEITVTWTDGKDKKIEKKYTVTVKPIEVEVGKISLSKQEMDLVIGDKAVLNPSIEPMDAPKEVEYNSSNPEYVEVAADGTITAKKETLKDEPVTITVSAKNKPAVNTTIKINVIDVPVSIVFYNIEEKAGKKEEVEVTSYSVEETKKINLAAKLVYRSGKKVTVKNNEMTYATDNSKIAEVDATGCVTAGNITAQNLKFPQYAKITAEYAVSYKLYEGKKIDDGTVREEKTITGECEIAVVEVPVDEIKFDKTETSITLRINDTYWIKAVDNNKATIPANALRNDIIILPEDASVRDLVYKSSDEDVATVGKHGKITAVGIGEATITATSAADSTKQLEFKVKVYQTDFNVAELGANGADDKADSKAINTILAYADTPLLKDQTITVTIPDGTYLLNETLTIYSNTNLILSNGTIMERMKSAAGSHMLCSKINSAIGGYDQCKNITISGGIWDGNTDGSKSANGIYIGHAQNIVIRDTIVRNISGSHLIELAGVKNAIVENVELYGYVMCTDPNYNAKSTQAEKEALQLDYCGSVSTPAMVPHDFTPCENIVVRNCYIHDFMSGIGTHTSVESALLRDIVIENNEFENITDTCINLMNFENVTIKNNKASGFTTFLYASESTGTVTNNSAKNKSFEKMTTTNLSPANVVTVSNSSIFTITDNTFYKASSNGICVWNKSTATIKNNKIKNNGLYGIRTSASTIKLSKNTISGNKEGYYDTYSNAKVKSSDDVRAYYVDNLKASYKYTGSAIKPKIKLKGLNKKYYKVSYKNNKKAGTATITIKGKGKVKKSFKVKFKIKK